MVARLSLLGLCASLLSVCSDNAITSFLNTTLSNQSPGKKYSLTINVTGLLGNGLSVREGNETLGISLNGSKVFTKVYNAGDAFDLTIASHPRNPGQYCTVSQAKGTFAVGNVTVFLGCVRGNSHGPLIAGNIISPLSLLGNVDVSLNQDYAGTRGVIGTLDGPGTAARFDAPTQMATDGYYLYAQESTSPFAIRRIDLATRDVSTLGNLGGTDGLTTDGNFLYATNFNDCAIRKMDLTNSSVSLLAGQANACNFAEAPVGPGSTARFNTPLGITTDGQFLYVADYGNNRIRKVDPATGATTTLAGTGAASSINGPAASATFFAPHGLLFYGGKLYVNEGGNKAIRVIDIVNAPYSVSTLSGTGGFSCTDGAANVAEFKRLRHFATDGIYLYATDDNCYSVRRIDMITGNVVTLSGAEPRTTTIIGSGGLGGTAGFRSPMGIVSDGKNVFVSDSIDMIIRRIE